ncbi:hypothetical protein Drose_05695 [Dactylosporangium roseum]|uniref:Uncharacterized protein n=1 Tax=Dactylosporangium roseum TaxID=47989 RepID=A0ABY5Z6T7_9ACTN|nr:hypothetical protein [Dactylosporangium roseum]UWZ37763.1 hypothetical protein Drose_05695 [Dactylosporangium roseum]
MTDMPAAFDRVEAAIQAQAAGGREHDSLADAAIYTILAGPCRDLAAERPDYAEAFQALAERLGYI